MRRFESDNKSDSVEPLEHIKCPVYCHRTFYMPCMYDAIKHPYQKGVKCRYYKGLHYNYHKRSMHVMCNFDEGMKNVKRSRPPYKEKPYYATISS